jgi:hypothetical protein
MESFIKCSYDTIVYRLDLMPDEQMRILQWMEKLPLINRLDQGIPRYKYGVQFDGIRIYISDSTRLHPNVRVRFLSEYIQRVGWKKSLYTCLEIFKNALHFKKVKLFRKRLILSQVDLAYDFASDLSPWLNDPETFRVVTKHLTKRTFQRSENVTWTLWGSGSAGWKVRLYDKLSEVKNKTEKKYWLGVWALKGFTDPENVWRIEFELRNDFLKQFNIKSMAHLERMQSKILQFCVSNFHVVFNDDTNVSRCTWVPEFVFLRQLATNFDKEFYDFTPRYFWDCRDNAISRMKSSYRKALVYSLAFICKCTGTTKNFDLAVNDYHRRLIQRLKFDPIDIMVEVEGVLELKGFYYV